VHITDSHVRRKRKGNEGYARCIESINALKPKPAFALMGGDMVFDGNYTPKEEYLDQLEIVRTISNQLDMPYYACFGNHDKFGLSSRRKTTPDDPDIGPKLFMDAMGMKAPYYSFDFEGWHFVVLDSMFQVATEKGPSYEVKLGEEQLRWLARDLGRASGRPSVAVTHVAAFCNIGTINGDADMKAMSPGMVLRDTKDLRLILERHGCKALLQGHSHMIEEFAFDGVHYLTSAAASAAWWGATGLDSSLDTRFSVATAPICAGAQNLCLGTST
jgi:3',5'-cyclic AMP phosphodiesterase CpdA